MSTKFQILQVGLKCLPDNQFSTYYLGMLFFNMESYVNVKLRIFYFKAQPLYLDFEVCLSVGRTHPIKGRIEVPERSFWGFYPKK